MNAVAPKIGDRPALSAYLLGTIPLAALLGLQRRLVYDVGGRESAGAVIVCDHPAGITIGREGSALHIRPSSAELQARGWPVHWVSRGGGAMLHLPGQVTCYPILPLDRLNLTPAHYLEELQAVVMSLLSDYNVCGFPDPGSLGVRAGARRIAHVGAAVRNGVTAFGMVINVDPDLDLFRDVACDGDPLPMTSMNRETIVRVRAASVRQKLVELLAARFGFDRVSPFHTYPGALPRPARHATARTH